jgi:hypothetical protein
LADPAPKAFTAELSSSAFVIGFQNRLSKSPFVIGFQNRLSKSPFKSAPAAGVPNRALQSNFAVGTRITFGLSAESNPQRRPLANGSVRFSAALFAFNCRTIESCNHMKSNQNKGYFFKKSITFSL